MMPPELQSKQQFAETLDAQALPGRFAFISRFLFGSLDEARLILAGCDLARLKLMATCLKWKKTGASLELAGRLLEWKTVFDFARCRDLPAIIAHKQKELDFALGIVGKRQSFGNKSTRAQGLLNFVKDTLTNLRVNVGEQIQFDALSEAVSQRRPIGIALVEQYGVRTAAERVGYVERLGRLVCDGPIQEVYSVDGKMVAAETIDRLIEAAQCDIQSKHKAIANWTDRIACYSPGSDWQMQPDTLQRFAQVDETPEQFAARLLPIATRCLEEAKQKLIDAEARLLQLREIKLESGSPPEPIVFQGALMMV